MSLDEIGAGIATYDGFLEGQWNAPDLLNDAIAAAVREAEEQGKAIDAHFAHLIVHGMLHLQGHTHENEEDTARMESIEVGILAALGYPDPYA